MIGYNCLLAILKGNFILQLIEAGAEMDNSVCK